MQVRILEVCTANRAQLCLCSEGDQLHLLTLIVSKDVFSRASTALTGGLHLLIVGHSTIDYGIG